MPGLEGRPLCCCTACHGHKNAWDRRGGDPQPPSSLLFPSSLPSPPLAGAGGGRRADPGLEGLQAAHCSASHSQAWSSSRLCSASISVSALSLLSGYVSLLLPSLLLIPFLEKKAGRADRQQAGQAWEAAAAGVAGAGQAILGIFSSPSSPHFLLPSLPVSAEHSLLPYI